MGDSSDIDQAVITKLSADPTLLSYMPNGVYWETAPPNSTRFVLVSLVDARDEGNFGARAYEDILYQITAVGLTTANPNMKAAAARIDTLLEDGALSVAGYRHMVMYREARIRLTEVDDEDPDIRWFHRGGYYRVQMAVTP